MFRVHMPIIRRIRCVVAEYGFLHRVCGMVVVLRAAAYVVCTVRMVPCGTAPSAPYTQLTQRLSRPPPFYKHGAENHMLQLNI